MTSAVLLHEPDADSREFLERHLRDDGFENRGQVPTFRLRREFAPARPI